MLFVIYKVLAVADCTIWLWWKQVQPDYVNVLVSSTPLQFWHLKTEGVNVKNFHKIWQKTIKVLVKHLTLIHIRLKPDSLAPEQ